VRDAVLFTFEELVSHLTDILTNERSIDTEGLTRPGSIGGWRRWPPDPVPNQPRGRHGRVHREARTTLGKRNGAEARSQQIGHNRPEPKSE
jgi:hypothetical protein